MERANRKKSQPKRGMRRAGAQSRRGFLKIIGIVLTVAGSVDGLLSLGERCRKLLAPTPVNVVATPAAGSLRVVASTAVSIGESVAVGVGDDAHSDPIVV